MYGRTKEEGASCIIDYVLCKYYFEMQDHFIDLVEKVLGVLCTDFFVHQVQSVQSNRFFKILLQSTICSCQWFVVINKPDKSISNGAKLGCALGAADDGKSVVRSLLVRPDDDLADRSEHGT